MHRDKDLIATIKLYLIKHLSKERYEHSINVSLTASAMAMAYGIDYVKAEIAGLLHDVAKAYTDTDLVQACREAGIAVDENHLKSVQVLHAMYGAYLARKLFHIDDEEILSAICWHTTGKAQMTPLEMCIFIADYIEPMRDKAKDLTYIRQLAFRNLQEAMYKISADTIEFLESKHTYINTKTIECYEYYSRYKEN